MNSAYKTALLATALTLQAIPAFALDEIYSPNVEAGETSVEYGSSRTFDHDSSINNDQSHEFVLEHSFTDRFVGEVSAGLDNPSHGPLELSDIEVEGRYQFTESGQYWMDSGMLAAYGVSTHDNTPDSVEMKLLLQKDIGKTTSTANIGFEQEVGRSAHGGPEYLFLWNTRYRYNEYFQPGIEIQSELGTGATLAHFNQQEHYVGPAVYGKLFGHVKYQVAWLAGASDASANSAARLLLEYEMHF